MRIRPPRILANQGQTYLEHEFESVINHDGHPTAVIKEKRSSLGAAHEERDRGAVEIPRIAEMLRDGLI
jgi:hypothetical protein